MEFLSKTVGTGLMQLRRLDAMHKRFKDEKVYTPRYTDFELLRIVQDYMSDSKEDAQLSKVYYDKLKTVNQYNNAKINSTDMLIELVKSYTERIKEETEDNICLYKMLTNFNLDSGYIEEDISNGS